MTQLHNDSYETAQEYRGPMPSGEVLDLCSHRLQVVGALIQQVESGLEQPSEVIMTDLKAVQNPLLESQAPSATVVSLHPAGTTDLDQDAIRRHIDELRRIAS